MTDVLDVVLRLLVVLRILAAILLEQAPHPGHPHLRRLAVDDQAIGHAVGAFDTADTPVPDRMTAEEAAVLTTTTSGDGGHDGHGGSSGPDGGSDGSDGPG